MTKVHIVTGGSSGIGKECAASFTEGKVIITARREQKLIEAVEELKSLGVDAVYKTCDISNREQVAELMDYANTLGTVQTVVNSAGVSGVGGTAKQTFEIDLVGSEYILEEALRVIAPTGVVLLISSMMGHMVPPNETYDSLLSHPLVAGNIDQLVSIAQDSPDTAYNFSKRGVHLLVKKYAVPFGEKGARVVSISPGIIMTPMAEKAAEEHPEQMDFMKKSTPVGRNGEPRDIVNIMELLVSEKASFVTGTDVLVDGGLTINLGKVN